MRWFFPVCAVAALGACGSLNTKPWPDRSHDAKTADSGPPGDLVTVEISQPSGDGAVGKNPDVGQTPPSGKWLLPKQGAAVPLAMPVTFEAEVSSPYVKPSELFVGATLTTGPIDGLPILKVGDDGHVKFELSTLPAGPQTVVLLVLDGGNPAVAVPLSIYVDTPPGTPSVAISPKDPKSQDDLVAKVTAAASDIDLGEAATQTYQYEWLIGETPTDVTSATVPAAKTEPGQVWTVRARAWDGANLGPPGQATVKIGNIDPQLPKVQVSPPNASMADTLVCDMAVPATDTDGQNLQFKFSWTLNGMPFAAGDNKAQLKLAEPPKAGQLGGYKALLAVKAGDVLACSVLVTDGIAIVGPADASPVAVGAYDGCKAVTFPCALAANCTPTDTAAVTCTCAAGMAGDGTVCVDQDECQNGSNQCDPAADCTNTFGGYTCGCPSGYTGNGFQCTDNNECASGQFSCGLASDCSNTAGGYDCVCKKGYTGDGQTCTDQDECLLGLLLCDPHADCKNLPGDATCVCGLGWAPTETTNGTACVDLDECATATGLPACVTGAVCSNFEGGFDCTCGPGWLGDGKTCANIDECAEKSFVCAAQAGCQDIDGGYLCVCGKGYIGDGKTCDDVDECQTGGNDCDPKALCTNTVGGFTCACKNGFTGDGKTCKLVAP